MKQDRKPLKSMTRREFVGAGSKAAIILAGLPALSRAADFKIAVCGHLWVYASRFPAPYDCSAILEEVFSDLKYAGIEGVELMEVELRHDDAVDRIQSLIQKYHLPVFGTSYGANLWDKDKHAVIEADVKLVAGRLQALGGRTFGIRRQRRPCENSSRTGRPGPNPGESHGYLRPALRSSQSA